MTWLAFVALPRGVCATPEDQRLDFDRIYLELLRPALETAGFRVTRLDPSAPGGDIDGEPARALLQAELVVADLTLDSGGIGHLLGRYQAWREDGLILVHASTATPSLQPGPCPRLTYRLRDGAPDPSHLAADRAALTRLALESLSALPPRPTRRAMEDRPRQPRDCDGRARREDRPGDLLVLAGEAPNRRLRIEDLLAAGDALVQRGQQAFALEQFEAALALDPTHRPGRERRARGLCRVQRIADARAAAQDLLRDADDDAGCWDVAGDVEQEAWIGDWRTKGAGPELQRARAQESTGPLDAAIAAYRNAFLADPCRFEAGSKALRLDKLREHLGRDPDPESTERLLGGLHWSCHRAREREPGNLQARFCHAELSLLTQAREILLREFRGAVVAAAHDLAALETARQRLSLLRDLGFRPQETAAVLSMIEREIARTPPPFEPRQVFLFSGHMVDTPARATPRFPSSKVPAAARKIAETLDQLGATAQDLALSQAAAGGDLLFLEACRQRGLRCEVLLPFAEAEFIQRSILPSDQGEQWRDRYYTLKPQLQIRDAPQELGPKPDKVDPYERCNLWLFYTALSWGAERLRFVTLWNGGGGDSPGGTAHMVSEVERRSGQVTWIDPRQLEVHPDAR